MADRQHIACTDKRCIGGVIVEPPGSWYGAAVVVGDCEECSRLFQQEQEKSDD